MKKKFFFDTFTQIKKQLSVSSEILKCDKPVKKTIISSPDENILADQLFLSDQQVFIEGEPAQQTDSIEDKKTMILKSVSEALVNYGSSQNEAVAIQEFEEIQQMLDEQAQDKTLETNLNLIHKIANHQIELEMLNEDKLTKLQSSLNDSETLLQIITQNTLDPNNLDKTHILKSMKNKVGGCFTRSKSIFKQSEQNNKQLTGPAFVISQIIKEIKDGLSKYRKKFEIEMPQDCKNDIQEFYSVIQDKLKEFGSLNSEMIDSETHCEAFTLNKILEQINLLLQQKKIINWQLACQTIHETLKIDSESLAQMSTAICDESDDFKYLPFFQQQVIDDDWESVLFAIFDNNESMIEYEMAITQFNQIFQEIDEQKIILVSLRNCEYTIYKTKQTHPSFVDIIKSLESEFQLRKKKIYVCVVSDGQTEYRKLNCSVKIAKKNYQNIKLVYVAVGMNFKTALENDLLKKSQTSDNKGKPKIYIIPRKQNVQIQQIQQQMNNQANNQTFEKAFIDLKEFLFQNNIIPQRTKSITQLLIQQFNQVQSSNNASFKSKLQQF